ncbi:hypothetical protein [Actinomadura fibrosa]|uniref:Tetratricopeptide repeat protein n=1 Tax=Actinomadura fibrosa TaxID=111802 RepID=A0ABW2XCL1_9ACTN|nr:hypothetical protein [Actinomadura fibrosa]
MSDEARALLEGGDIPGLLRHLRFHAEEMNLAEVARLMEGAAALSGFDDLREAAAAVAVQAAPQELYDFGYACVERGVPFLAVPALREALRLVPREKALVMELVSALEREERHEEAVAVLDDQSALDDWPDRYLLAHNALMAGDLDRASDEAARLATPADDRWLPARDRLARALGRAEAARSAGPLDDRDLRGWHFALGGGVLLTLSPFGFDDGMNGRFAYLGDSYDACRRSIERLRLVLDAAGQRPREVALLDDRSSRILGLATAEVLGLPARPFEPGRPSVLVVAYDLREVDAGPLWERAEEQILFEHATCWTDPPQVSADVSGVLHQTVTRPWGERLRLDPERREPERLPEDERSPEELASEIVRADPQAEPGDDGAPADGDDVLTAFVAAVRDRWLTGTRDAVHSPGPVHSSRFL